MSSYRLPPTGGQDICHVCDKSFATHHDGTLCRECYCAIIPLAKRALNPERVFFGGAILLCLGIIAHALIRAWWAR